MFPLFELVLVAFLQIVLERGETEKWFILNKLRLGQRVRVICLVTKNRSKTLVLIVNRGVEAVGFCRGEDHLCKREKL